MSRLADSSSYITLTTFSLVLPCFCTSWPSSLIRKPLHNCVCWPLEAINCTPLSSRPRTPDVGSDGASCMGTARMH
ncbi:hypothetical protein F5B20DRAFT_545426 [Whalleya microplaca]|nr:hypothetical protein F5B20DRAFT_545426 [Whalleya microplaca]